MIYGYDNSAIEMYLLVGKATQVVNLITARKFNVLQRATNNVENQFTGHMTDYVRMQAKTLLSPGQVYWPRLRLISPVNLGWLSFK
jgi:hypothetical protein